MKIIAMIPARYAATRFPAKLMQLLGGIPVITRTYQAVVATGLFHQVYVVTDSSIIFDEITAAGGQAIMSLQAHESGSDRIAEAVAGMDVDVIINVQGDEPLIRAAPLAALVDLFRDPSVKVGSLMRVIRDEAELRQPSAVKVVVDGNMDALYFSRAAIPYVADASRAAAAAARHYLHIGVYGYRKPTLISFTNWPAGSLEIIEKLEQLRYLEQGVKIRMALVEFAGQAIDTPEDLERAKKLLSDGAASTGG